MFRPCEECRVSRYSWKYFAKMTECFHLRKLLDGNLGNRGWSVRKTALSLDRSLGSVSEDLKLSLALRIYPEVSEFKTRDEAISYLRRKKKCTTYPCGKWSVQEIRDIIMAISSEFKSDA